MQADGYSLDDKRQPLVTEDKLGLQPSQNGRNQLSKEEHAKNNLPDVLARWAQREGTERQRSRTDQSFCVPKADIAANGYDLSINRYKEVVHAQVQHRAPSEILAELAKLEDEIAAGMKALEGMLK
jgi:type I restriction enzyme M protein